MTTETSTDRSITLIRDYPVAPAKVFAAWTEPEKLEWFSGLPAAQSEPSVDLQVGGFWRVLLQEGPDGRRYATGGRYLEIDAPHRLVFSWGAVDGWPELDPENTDATPLVSLDFVATDQGTRMTASLSLSENLEPGEVEHWFSLGIREGWTMTIDRIAQAVTE